MSTLIIAEAGVNHNGSLDRALQMIEVAADCGADIVKFQAWSAELLTSSYAQMADYQVANTGTKTTQLDLLKSLELPRDAYPKLISKCHECGVEFLCTPMDIPSIEFLVSLEVNRMKLPSGELTNAPFLLAAGQTKIPLIVSTGMANSEEIKAALGVIAWGALDLPNSPDYLSCIKLWEDTEATNLPEIILLHCTTEYPAPLKDVNLMAMNYLAKEFRLAVGYSDHTEGINVSVAAAALGARVIEKHFTLDRNLPGPDHKASIEAEQLKELIKAVREIEFALGNEEKKAVSSEIKNMPIARKSLVAAMAIKAGELFNEKNLTTKRPGNGISPWKYWELIGRPAERNFAADELITLK